MLAFKNLKEKYERKPGKKSQVSEMSLSEAHNVGEQHCDVASMSLIEVWIDETEPCTWFLSETKRGRK